jgi:hypothetical protein
MEAWPRWESLERHRAARAQAAEHQRKQLPLAALPVTISSHGAMVQSSLLYLDEDGDSSGGDEEGLLDEDDRGDAGKEPGASLPTAQASGVGGPARGEEPAEWGVEEGAAQDGASGPARSADAGALRGSSGIGAGAAFGGVAPATARGQRHKSNRSRRKGPLRMTRLRLRALDFLRAIPMEAERVEAAELARATEAAALARAQEAARESLAAAEAEGEDVEEQEGVQKLSKVTAETAGPSGIRLRGKTDVKYASRRAEGPIGNIGLGVARPRSSGPASAASSSAASAAAGLGVAAASGASAGGGASAAAAAAAGGGGGGGGAATAVAAAAAVVAVAAATTTAPAPAPAAAAAAAAPAVEPKSRERYERELIAAGAHDGSRLLLSWDKGYPAMVVSVIKYEGSRESRTVKKSRLAKVIMEVPRRRNEVPKVLPDAAWVNKRWGTSYARYFNAEWASKGGDRVEPARAAEEEWWNRHYQPGELDDQRIRQGKHRTVQSLDGYMLSVLPYTKTKDLKAELNEVFREQHPELPPELTLSKIRNLKKEVLLHVRTLDLELSTAALAIVFFEKLVVKGVVCKANRKLVMAACLVIAYKFNEPRREGMATLKDLLADIEKVQLLTPKQVLEAEFSVYGHLLFHLHIDKEHCVAHFQRLLRSTGMTPTEYLGEELAEFYFPTEQAGKEEMGKSEALNTTEQEPASPAVQRHRNIHRHLLVHYPRRGTLLVLASTSSRTSKKGSAKPVAKLGRSKSSRERDKKRSRDDNSNNNNATTNSISTVSRREAREREDRDKSKHKLLKKKLKEAQKSSKSSKKKPEPKSKLNKSSSKSKLLKLGNASSSKSKSRSNSSKPSTSAPKSKKKPASSSTRRKSARDL